MPASASTSGLRPATIRKCPASQDERAEALKGLCPAAEELGDECCVFPEGHNSGDDCVDPPFRSLAMMPRFASSHSVRSNQQRREHRRKLLGYRVAEPLRRRRQTALGQIERQRLFRLLVCDRAMLFEPLRSYASNCLLVSRRTGARASAAPPNSIVAICAR